MATFLISLIAGVAAGAITAKTIVKRELAARDAQARVPVAPPAPPPAPPATVMKAPEPVAPAAPAAPEEITPEILTVLTAAIQTLT